MRSAYFVRYIWSMSRQQLHWVDRWNVLEVKNLSGTKTCCGRFSAVPVVLRMLRYKMYRLIWWMIFISTLPSKANQRRTYNKKQVRVSHVFFSPLSSSTFHFTCVLCFISNHPAIVVQNLKPYPDMSKIHHFEVITRHSWKILGSYALRHHIGKKN